MQLIFMLVSNPFPDGTTLVPGARHKCRSHLTYRSDAIHIPNNRPVRSLLYCEECSVLPEVLREGHASLKFVLTNR
jgi:hypothetical protein